MLKAYRRGPASICQLARTANTTFAPNTRSSTFSLAVNKTFRPAITSRHFHLSLPIQRNAASAAIRSRVEEKPRENATAANGTAITKFHELADRGLVHDTIVSEITGSFGHHTMTQVQALTINETLKGIDIVAQARTGTGKTLGFLIPVVQNILKDSPELASPPRRGDRARPSDIRAIIMSPTRELAEQIAAEARKLTRGTSVQVQVAVGGNSKSVMLRQMQREGCHLLVATPGRLNDLLTDSYSRVSAPNLKALVLDEADRLLDSGFADAIEDIIMLLPDRSMVDRQTLLFSATVPREVMHLVRKTLKPDFKFVQTVQEGEQATHEKVPQKIVEVEGIENFMPTLLELCKRECEKATRPSSVSGEVQPFKAIVYFSSTANVELSARIFENLKASPGGLFGKHPLWPAEISEMHGKLSQEKRTRVSERFRRAKSAIMFSSDVTARGMDFPNVTHVIQIGLPPNRDQYIHRVGRTGRGDKLGEAWIMVTPLDMREARYRLKGLPIFPDKSLEASKVNMTQDAQLPTELATTLTQVADATKMVDKGTKVAAYLASLGQVGNNDKQGVMDMLNQWTRYGWGWEVPPSIGSGLANKLGLSNLRGLQIGDSSNRSGAFGSGHGQDRERGRFGESRGGQGSFEGDRGGSYGGGRGGRGGFGNGRGRSNNGGDRRGRSDYGERASF